MAGSGQDNSSGTGSGNPVVRLRGFPKKDAEPRPPTPVIPPPAPNRPAEVRFKRRASSQPVEDVPSVEALPAVEEPVPVDGVSPVEDPGGTVEPFVEYPVGQADQTFDQTIEEAPVQQADQAFDRPFEEVPVEQYGASPSPVEPPRSWAADSPSALSLPEATPKSPAPCLAGSPIVAGSPSVAGVRIRVPPKAAPASIEGPAAAYRAAPAEARSPAPSTAPASPRFQPDTDIDRIHRRQWWKYDLRVKAGRQPAEETKQQV